MKKQTFLLTLSAMMVVVSSCKKNNEEPVIPPLTYPNFSQLKVGNYWIYQQFDIDASGNATPKDLYDSCYVEKDTVINNIVYFKVFRPSIIAVSSYSFLRDSLHYIVDSSGNILFSSQDFATVFSSNYVFAGPGDTVCQITKKMEDVNVTVTTPAGEYITSNAKETYSMYPNWTFAGNPRHKHTRYAEDIGIVIETLPFYASSLNYIERRLIRYHLN